MSEIEARTKELINFLTARLDEDEAIIRRNLGKAGLGDDGDFPDYRTYDGPDLEAAVDYLAHFAPLRQLREVAAKRAILDEHIHYRNPDDSDEVACDICHLGRPDRGYRASGWCVTVAALARVYRDHPDYRQEWVA